MGYLFSIIAFLILIPIVLKLNLGIKTSAKLIILSVAFLISVIGVLAVPLLGIIKTVLILSLLTLIIGYVLGNRITAIEVDSVVPFEEKDTKAKPKNNIIIVQEQKDDQGDLKQEVISNIQDDDLVEIDEDVTFLDQRDAFVQLESSSNEAAATHEDSIDMKSDWLNGLTEMEEELPKENQVQPVTHLNLEIDPDKLEEITIEDSSNWLNEISELQDNQENETKEKSMMSDGLEHTEELDTLDEIKERKEELKAPTKKQLAPTDELDTLDELIFETTDQRKK